MKRDYELGFILSPEVNEEQTRAILDRVEGIVANYGGQIVRVNQWGRRRLAYPIQRHRDGFYVFVDMILTPETVIEIDRTLKVTEEVLRHMVRRRDPKAVQKEREISVAAASAPPPPVTIDEVADVEDIEMSGSEEDTDLSEVLSAEDIEFVPPAIEETIEA